MSVTSLERGKKQRSKKWEVIDVPPIDELEMLSESELVTMTLPAGFCIRFFCHDMHHLYTVASQQVMITRGVIDYLHDFNQLGPNKSRNKLFLCSQFDAECTCRNGSLCREVHCKLKLEDAKDAGLYHVSSNATGAPNAVRSFPGAEIIERKLNESLNVSGAAIVSLSASMGTPSDDPAPVHTVVPSNVLDVPPSAPVPFIPDDVIVVHSLHSRWTSRRTYDTLPAGVTFSVALPNTPTPVDAYDSGNILVTRGAKEYYDAAVKNEPLNVTMQHCAHYSKNGTCCFGQDCQFVHVLHYRARERGDVDGSCSDGESVLASSVSSSNDGVTRSRTKRINSVKETPLSFGQVSEPRQKKGSTSSSRSASSGNRSGAGNGGGAASTGGGQGGSAALSGPSPMGAVGQAQGNQFMVPQLPTWISPAVQSGGQQPLLFPSLQMQQPLPQAGQQQQPMMVAPSGAPLMMMRGVNGEVFFVPQGSGQQAQSTHQPFYVMPMQPFQGA